jgi:hypothetical protein
LRASAWNVAPPSSEMNERAVWSVAIASSVSRNGGWPERPGNGPFE